jgi:hypothetical protein
MLKNLTLRVDDTVLRRARIEAVKRDQSLSQWVAELIEKAVEEDPQYEAARRSARRLMARGFHLGGKALSREALHER